MADMQCILAGLTRLFGPVLLMILWHKKTGAGFTPALVAFPVCYPVFFIGAAIRSVFSHSNPAAYYIKQGLLFGILEEGAKFLVLCYLLSSYDSRKDAVSYGIGHSAFEAFGAGMTCLGLIGTGRAAPDIFWFNLWAFMEGTASAVALTVLIFYGIYTGRNKWMLPAAIRLHALGNASQGLFIKPAAITVNILLTAGECFAAYRCWEAMRNPYEDEI